MMDQETWLRRIGTPVKTDSDGLFTHAFLPGLFRAVILKPRYNKRKQNCEDPCRRRKEADLILIANASGETFSADGTRTCPAYRYCVERAAAAATSVAGITMDQNDSVVSSEISTLRDLLGPIKQTAMRMKQLSQAQDCMPQDIFCNRSSQTNNCCELEDEESLICQMCGMKKSTAYSMDEADTRRDMDGKVYVRIISGPGMEAQGMAGDPLMNVIQGMVSQMADRREQPQGKEGFYDCREMGVQSPGLFTEKPDTQGDECHSVPSYEVIETMDIGCGNEPITNLCPRCQEESDPRSVQDVTVDTMLLKLLMILKNNQEIYSGNVDTTQASIKPKSKSSDDLCTGTIKKEDKGIDCVCNDPEASYSEVKSGSKVEVTNEVSFKSSYFVENLETMSVQTATKDQPSEPCSSLKDVSTSTYKVSIYKQITSMSQSKMTSSRKRTSSSQCDIGPEPVRRLSSDAGRRFRDSLPETIEELCPCGCGFFLEGDDTCSCGCGAMEDSPCQVATVPSHNAYTMDSAIGSKTMDAGVPLDPVVKLMSNICGNDEIVRDCPSINEVEGTSLEEEARKLQYKIQCYKQENEHFRKLIQQACKGCDENVEALSHTPPIRATYSGLATAIEILQAKCRSKDGMIAILAEGLRGVVNYAQIAKNLAAPCLEYTYWDFDQSALYTYLRGTMSRPSMEGCKDAVETSEMHKAPQPIQAKDPCAKTLIPAPTDFKIEQQLCKCLFVSWKIPTNIENVAGYRIYINGNLATNVRSPTRTETILGFVETSKPAVLVLHSVGKEGELSDPVTLNYQSGNDNN